jgi:ribose transport system permease protein
VVAMGMALLLISGNFDLSVGGIGAFCVIVGAKAINSVGLAPGLAIILGVGLVCGAVNGLIVVRVGVNSLVATLGTGYALTGMAAVLSGASPVTLTSNTLSTVINASPAQIPVSVMILVGVIVLASLFSHTIAGRALYAVGANREAARYTGIPVERVSFIPFLLTGAFASVAAIIDLGFIGGGLATTGSDWALTAIAGAVVGGISIAGGEGSIAAAVVGMVLIGVVQNGLVLLNINSNYQDIVLGVIIVTAVAVDVRVRSRLARAVAPRRARLSAQSAPISAADS